MSEASTGGYRRPRTGAKYSLEATRLVTDSLLACTTLETPLVTPLSRTITRNSNCILVFPISLGLNLAAMTSLSQNNDGQRAKGGGAALGADFTSNVIAAMGPNTPPRLREVMSGLIRHIHDFAREVQLTTDEWMAGVQMINWAGQMSDDKRNEGQLLCDVIGLES